MNKTKKITSIILFSVLMCFLILFLPSFATNDNKNNDSNASENTQVVESTTTNVKNANVEENETIDAVTKQYLESNVNTSYSKVEKMELANIMLVKQTLVDESKLNGLSTIDDIMKSDNYAELVYATLPTTVSVYNLSDDSDYLVAYVNTMQDDKNATVLDYIFAKNNNNGEVVDNCILDKETGIAYIPKSLYINENGENILSNIQVQLLQAEKSKSMENVTSQVDATTQTDNNTTTGSGNVNVFDFETTVKTQKNLSKDEMIVSINGIPVDDNNYTYDKKTGEITMEASSSGIQSIDVKVDQKDVVAKIKDTLKPMTVKAAVSPSGMKVKGTITAADSIVTGSYFTPTLSVAYGEGGSGYNGSYGIGPTVDMAQQELANLIAYGGSLDYSRVNEQRKLQNLHVTFTSNNGLDLSEGAVTLIMECSHISNPLGKGPSTGGDWKAKDMTVAIRVLDINRSASNPYIILGVLTPTVYTQAGSGIFKFNLNNPKGTISLNKLTANDKITNNDTYYTLGNASYGLYSDSNCTNLITTLTTNNNGNASYSIKAGTYYIKEISPSIGYLVDESIHTVTVNAGKTTTINSYETPKTAKIELEKIDGNPDFTQNNESYTLKDAEYTIYTDETCSTVFDTMKTDENGKATIDGLPLNNYWVKETKASKGYQLDENIYPLDLTTSVDAEITGKVTSTEMPFIYNKEISLLLGKVDKDTNQNKPSGSASLEGAEYTVKFYEGIYNHDPFEEKLPTKKWIFKTDENGQIKFTDEYKVSGSELYEQGKLPLGTITIQETKAPEGYLINNDVMIVNLNTTDDNTELETYNLPIQPEEVVKGDFLFRKVALNEDDNTETALEGAKFTVTSKTTGKVVMTVVSDKNGIITSTSKDATESSLPYDTYILTEIEAPEGVDKIEPIEFTINQNQQIIGGYIIKDRIILSPITIIKIDEETGQTIKAANTTFRILDEDKNPIAMKESPDSKKKITEFKTDENGQVTLSERLKYGTYYIEEVNAPNGYLKGDLYEFKVEKYATFDSPLVIKYADKNAMGQVKVNKLDKENKTPISDVTYTIKAAEDIITNDGTIRAKKGDIVDVIRTNENGIATSKQLYLGKYSIQETKQHDGYVRDLKSYDFELTYKDQNTPISITELNFENKESIIGINKFDQTSIASLSNVQFKIWNKEIGEDSATIYTTDKNGKIEIKGIKVGRYCVKEIKTRPGYAVKDEIREFTVSEDGRINEKDSDVLNISNVHIQMIGTIAVNKDTNDHFALGVNSTILDTVKMTGLQVGKEYTLKATPMDVETGKPILNQNKPVMIEHTFVATKSNEDIPVEILVNTSEYKNKKINIFEELYDEGVLIAEHKDLKDENQTIEIKDVKIGTTAIANDTNTKFSKYGDKTILTDTVKFKNVIPNLEYMVVGTIMDRKSGLPIIVNEQTVSASTTFTPTEENGNVDVTFEFNSNELKGKDIVIYESLLYKGDIVANHNEITDKDQTIDFPNMEIKTSVINKDTNTQFAQVGDKLTFVDTVSYKGLIPDYEFILKGKIIDKTTGEPLKVDEKEVTAETKFTPEKSEGTTKVTFTINTTDLAGKDLVVFEKLYYGDVEFASHEDLNDKDQTITIPKMEIKTSVINKDTNTQFAQVGDKLTFIDTISYKGLIPGYEFILKGKIMDKTTGKPLKINDQEVTAEAKFTPEKSEGTTKVTFTVNTTDLVGKDLVVFEKLYYGDIEFANHEDLDDKDQTITIPNMEIKTSVINKDTNTQFAQVGDKLTFVDTVSYKGLIPNYEFTLKGKIMDKKTGESLKINGKEVTAEAKFTPEKSEGTTKVTFTVNTTDLVGKDLVVFEKLYYGNIKFTSHEDLNDKNQTISIPKMEIKTSVINKDTNTQFAQVGDKLTFVDTIFYKGLIPGYEFILKGKIMDKTTGKPLKINDQEVTAEAKFTPEKSEGTTKVTFTVNTTDLVGKDLVVFEKLYYGDIEFANHEDLDDKDQTITIPNMEIKTSVINKDTNTQFAQVGDKLTFVDTVSYKGLIPNYEFTLKGKIMDKKTGESLKINGKEVTAEAKFTPEKSEGTTKVTFTVNTTDLVGKDLVVFEKLYYGNIKFASHEDLNDKDQTIGIPKMELKTFAVNKDTNNKIAQVGNNVTFIDTVSYKGLIPNYEFTLKSKIMDKTTGESLKVDGKDLIAEAKFTPENSEGTTDVTFTVNTTDLAGKDLVVFEKLYYGDVEFASHEDLNDNNQTITVPNIKIKTNVINKDTNTQFAQIGNKLTFVDTISYEGLIPNKECTIKGKIVNKKTGEPILIKENLNEEISDEKEVTAETTFTPEKSEGTIDVTFTVNTTDLVGKDLVVFEKLYYDNIEFANHEDLEDKDQTISVPKIELGTKVINKDTNTQFAQVGDKLTFVDTVSYKGLVPNYEFTLKGKIINKETGEPLKINDQEVTEEAKFTPENSEGTTDVTFTVNTTDLADKDLVVFEKLYYGDVEFASHEDLEDKNQTITIPKIEIGTKVINKDTNNQTADVKSNNTFVDTVSYKGLVPGYEFILKGKIMDKTTGEPLKVDGKEVIAEAKFTPENSEGTTDVTFTVNTTNLAGKDLVVFEKLYYGDVEFASHEDLNDKNQTITVNTLETPKTTITQTGDTNKTLIITFTVIILLGVGYTIFYFKKRNK